MLRRLPWLESCMVSMLVPFSLFIDSLVCACNPWSLQLTCWGTRSSGVHALVDVERCVIQEILGRDNVFALHTLRCRQAH